MRPKPDNMPVIALDFDGVICDSTLETGITGWKAATALWQDMPAEVSSAMIDGFRLVRPIIETGYEAILAMRLLHLSESVEAIHQSFGNKAATLLAETNISSDDLKQRFGETRDIWIANDLPSWIAMNPLFPGVAEKLQQLGQLYQWYVVTTKQERFVKQILHANGIGLADNAIYGLDRNMSKVEVLAQLIAAHPGEDLHFVEDRLQTLFNVMNVNDLADVKLSFALWGYNTDDEKALAKSQPFASITLDEFLAL